MRANFFVVMSVRNKSNHIYIFFIGLFALLFAYPSFSQSIGDRVELDTFYLGMRVADTICVGESVRLSCDPKYADKDILSYEWIDVETGAVVSRMRDLVVSPKKTKKYVLSFRYLSRSPELVTNGDFEAGRTGFTTEYRFVNTTPWNAGSELWDEGTYVVGRNPQTYHPYFISLGDHTTGRGEMLIGNGDPVRNRIVWTQDIQVVAGEIYAFSTWVNWVNRGTGNASPLLYFRIGNQEVPCYGKNNQISYFDQGKWLQYYTTYQALNTGRITISLRNKCTDRNGNDFAVDDISFTPVSVVIDSVVVKVSPQVEIGPLRSPEYCEGTNVNIQPDVYGSGTLTYLWSKLESGVYQTKSTTPRLSIPGAQLTDAGHYRYVVQGVCKPDTVEFDLAIREKVRLNGKLRDTVRVCVGEKATLDADCFTGYAIGYKWSGPGSGFRPYTADSALYYKSSANLADAGQYTCRVTDLAGCSGLQTIFRVLEVAEKPNLRDVSVSDTLVCTGTSVTLNAWTDNVGASLLWEDVETGITYTKTSGESFQVTVNKAMKFRVWARNACDDSEAQLVEIGVKPELTTLNVTGDQTVCAGTDVTLSASVNTDAERYVTYLWTGPRTASTADLFIDLVTPADAGQYKVTVTDECGHTLQDSVNVGLMNDLDGLRGPGNREVCAGESVSFTLSGGGNSLRYVWMTPAGQRVPANPMVINNVQATDAGIYICWVTDRCGHSQPYTTSLLIRPEGNITPLADKAEVCPGETVAFKVKKEGTGGYYEWFRDGMPIGTADQDLILTSVTSAAAGDYVCVYTNGCPGNEKRIVCNLGVWDATRIVSRSPAQYVQPHSPVNLFVNAEGEANEYVWTIGDVEVGRGPVLNIPDIGEAGTYLYVCTVTGKCGKSWIAIPVNVDDYIHLTENKSVVLCEGVKYAYSAELLPVGCTASSDIQYSWKFNGREVSDKKALSFADFSEADAGTYICEITGTCGTARLELTVSVLRKPVLASLSVDKTLYCEGEDVRILTGADVASGLTYSWQKDSKRIPWNGETLILNDVLPVDGGNYTCKIENVCGNDEKSVAVVVKPQLQVAPADSVLELCIGDPVRLSVRAGGENIAYAWSGPSAENWTGGDSREYSNSGITADGAGRYRCHITSICGTATVYRTLRVESELAVNVPASRTVCTHTDQVLELRTNFEENVTWKWILPDGTVSDQRILYVNDVVSSGVYKYEVESRCARNSGEVSLNVYPEMGALSFTPDTAVCEGGTVNLSASVSGEGISYRWMGPRAFVVNGDKATIAGITPGQAGVYEIVVTDICNRSKNGKTDVSILRSLENIEISRDTAVCPGENIRLEVKKGAPGMAYEWRFKGSVKGSDAALELTALAAADAGDYICRTTGVCGVREDTVHVDVYKPLVVTPAPPLAPVCPGEDVMFTAVADGESLRYVWSKENAGYVGTLDPFLQLRDVRPRDAGTYFCDITSSCGTARLEYELEVLPSTLIVGAPTYKHASKDTSETLTVRAEGDHLTYEWYRDGVKQACDSATFVQEALHYVDTLYFMCIVSGTCGTDTVYTTLDVGDYRLANSSPDTICAGSSYAYLVEVVPYDSPCYGDEPAVYTWYRNDSGVNDTIKGAGQVLRFRDVQPGDAGTYYCHVWRDCGDTTFALTLVVLDVPDVHSISAVDSIVIEGTDYAIEVTASGSSLSYSWAKDAVPLRGENRPILEFLPAKVEDSGKYTVTVANKCGYFSRNSVLRVYEKTIVTSPKRQAVAVCYGEQATFRVEAVGKDLMYRWYLDGRLLAVSYDNFYCPEDQTVSGEYLCEVTGVADADSCYISFTVNSLPQVLFNGNLAVCRGSYLQEYSSGVANGVAYAWTFAGAEIIGNSTDRVIQVNWNGVGEGGKINLVHTDLLTGCRNSLEKEVIYQELPEVNLVLPEMVGYCFDSLALNQAWPSGGQYIVNGFPETVLQLTDKSIDYQVVYTYTDATTGCAANADRTVKIAPQPIVRLEKRTDMTGRCHTLALNVAEATPGTIRWDGDVDLDVTDPLHAVYVPSDQDPEILYFEVSLEDGYGCREEDYEYVTSVPLPRIALPADTIIGKCDAAEKILEIPVEYRTGWLEDIRWSPDTNVTDLSYSSAVLHFTHSGKYLFEATVLDALGCESKDTINVTVSDGPTVASRDVCYGEAIHVDCLDYDFVWSDGYGAAYRELRDTGSVSVHLEDTLGCQADAYFSVHPLPELSLPDTLLILKGETLLLQPLLDPKYAPYQIRWQDGSTDTEYTVSEAGEYEVVVADRLGCTTVATVVVSDRMKILSPEERKIILCFGEGVDFDVKVQGEAEEYRWYRNGELMEVSRSNIWKLSGLTEDAEYMCEVIGPSNSDTCRMSVAVKALPEVYLPEDKVVDVCREDLAYRIEGRYVTAAFDTLFWYPENSVRQTGNATGEVVFRDPGEYEYKLTVRDIWGCEGSDTIRFSVIGPLVIEGKEVCAGETISVDCSGYPFVWDDGYNQAYRQISEVGQYVLRGTNPYGCVTEAVFAVHPRPVFELPDTLYLYAGQRHLFEVNPDEVYGPYSIRWSNGILGESCEISDEGSYSVEVTDRVGCTTRKTVEVIRPVHYYAPNAFLPNSSGENSRFYLKDVNFSEPFEMYIYNRWGELVYKTKTIGFEGGWNGVYEGVDCLPGAYVWVAYSGGKVLGKGTLMLIR